jgi:hypothetical protein
MPIHISIPMPPYMGELCNPRGDREKGDHFLLANRSFFLEILERKYLPFILY